MILSNTFNSFSLILVLMVQRYFQILLVHFCYKNIIRYFNHPSFFSYHYISVSFSCITSHSFVFSLLICFQFYVFTLSFSILCFLLFCICFFPQRQKIIIALEELKYLTHEMTFESISWKTITFGIRTIQGYRKDLFIGRCDYIHYENREGNQRQALDRLLQRSYGNKPMSNKTG